jgi:hypothetical protein
MREGRRSDITDGVVWRCPQCKCTKSIREGSFFSKSRLPLHKWLLVLHCWSKEFPVKDAADDAEIHKNTECDIYRWLREVCSTKLLQTPIVLGGRGIVDQIDESLFRHKVKVILLKYKSSTLELNLLCSITMVVHQGQISGCLGWYIHVDVSHSPALRYMQIVHQRNAATLLPIIQQHVAPGTIIHSDEWRAYSRVQGLPNVAAHHMVNHSLEFVNTATGVHTENIESYWNRAKIKLKRMRGCHELELS